MPNKTTAEAVLDQKLTDHQRQIDTLLVSITSVASSSADNNKQIAVLIAMHEAAERSRVADSATMKDMAMNLAAMQKEMGNYGSIVERVTKVEGYTEQALHKAGNAAQGVALIEPLSGRVKAVEKMLEGFDQKKIDDAKWVGEVNKITEALTGRCDNYDKFIAGVTGASKGIKGAWSVLLAIGGGIAFIIGTGLTLYALFSGHGHAIITGE